MSNSKQGKDSEQGILKVFDAAEDPFLTSSEIANELSVSRQAVNYRLEQIREKGLVDKKKTGARAAGWWAELALRLSEDAEKRVNTADRENAHLFEELEEQSEKN